MSYKSTTLFDSLMLRELRMKKCLSRHDQMCVLGQLYIFAINSLTLQVLRISNPQLCIWLHGIPPPLLMPSKFLAILPLTITGLSTNTLKLSVSYIISFLFYCLYRWCMYMVVIQTYPCLRIHQCNPKKP